MATLRRLHSGMAPPHAFNRQSAFIVVGAVGLSLGAAYVWARHGNGKRPAPELGTSAPSPGKAPPPRKKRSGKRHKTRTGQQAPVEKDSDASDDGTTGPAAEAPSSSSNVSASAPASRAEEGAAEASEAPKAPAADLVAMDADPHADEAREAGLLSDPPAEAVGQSSEVESGEAAEANGKLAAVADGDAECAAPSAAPVQSRVGGEAAAAALLSERQPWLPQKDGGADAEEGGEWIAVERKPRRSRKPHAAADASGAETPGSSPPSSPARTGGGAPPGGAEAPTAAPLPAAEVASSVVTDAPPAPNVERPPAALPASLVEGGEAAGGEVDVKKKKKKVKTKRPKEVGSVADAAAAAASEADRAAAAAAAAAAELDARDAAQLQAALAASAAQAEAEQQQRGEIPSANGLGDASSSSRPPPLDPPRDGAVSEGTSDSSPEAGRATQRDGWQQVKPKRRGKRPDTGPRTSE